MLLNPRNLRIGEVEVEVDVRKVFAVEVLIEVGIIRIDFHHRLVNLLLEVEAVLAYRKMDGA